MVFLRVLICAMVAILSSMNLYPTNVAGNTVVLDRTDDPVLRFVVCSDIHMDDTAQCTQYGRLEKLFRHSYEYAESQSYDSVDAFVFVGDIINSGKKAQADLVNEVVANEMKPGTPLMCVYDNHDIGNGNTIAECEEWFGVPANEDRTINDFHFITVSYNDNHSYATRLPSLYKQLNNAKKEDPKKPVFVFNHRHIQGTVYGSTHWGTADLSSVLNLFPQIVDFSGHSHYPITTHALAVNTFFPASAAVHFTILSLKTV